MILLSKCFRLFSCQITKKRVLSLSTHCLPFSTAQISNSELTSLNDIALIPREFKRLTWSFIRLISGETTTTIFFSRVSLRTGSQRGRKKIRRAGGSHSFCSRFKPEKWRKCCKELLPVAGVSWNGGINDQWNGLQAPLRTPSSPDRSQLVPLALGYTRLSRPKPIRDPVRRLGFVFSPSLRSCCTVSCVLYNRTEQSRGFYIC